jgi:hypothetical protein
LVDYPSLMEFTSYDWHMLWIDHSVKNTEIQNGFYHLRTTCREEYTFDVRTGQIVEELRFWRKLHRRSVVILTAIGILGFGLLYRRHRTRRTAAANARISSEPVLPIQVRKRFQYSLRSLMIFVTAAAVDCSIACSLGLHYAVFATGTALAVFLTCVLWRRRRWITDRPTTLKMKCRSILLWLLTVISWYLAFGLSLGPAAAWARHNDWPHDSTTVLIQVVYGPVTWPLTMTHIDQWGPIKAYFQKWFDDSGR